MPANTEQSGIKRRFVPVFGTDLAQINLGLFRSIPSSANGVDVMAINETNANGRRFIDRRLSVGNIITILGMIIGGLSMCFGLGERVTVLKTNLTSQAADIVQMSSRLQRIEERAGDVRERLKGIEATQQQQNETLKRIPRAASRAELVD